MWGGGGVYMCRKSKEGRGRGRNRRGERKGEKEGEQGGKEVCICIRTNTVEIFHDL